MSDANDWHELIDRHLRGELSESEKERLAELLDSDSSARKDFVEQVQWDTRLGEVLREGDDSSQEPYVGDRVKEMLARRTATKHGRSPMVSITRGLLAVAAVAVVALAASWYFQRPSAEREIARITGSSGSLLWTINGGRVVQDLSVGAGLSGGTVEGLAPDSWVELEFNDGSTVAISGNSTLTFSNLGQKELHLKTGSVSGNIEPQPPGKPMLIYTRSAVLEVVGTQFEIEAELSATMLNVSKGKVRVKRLSDGNTVDVPARHRVVAAADREMLLELVPDSVNRWTSQLHLGPVGTRGKWSPQNDREAAKLRAAPFTTRLGQTIYTASFGVSFGDQPAVIVQPASRLRVHGHIASTQKVYFGLTVRHANGVFAGNFQTTRPAGDFQSGEDFEAILHIRDFQLDPSLLEMKDRLPSVPFDLVVESMWCHTLDKQAGLEVTEVELIPPVK